MSVASATLLEHIVARVKSWAVGACVVAAAALLSRATEDGHQVVPRADLWIAAGDAAEDEEKRAMLLDDETAGGGAAGAAGAAAGAGAAGVGAAAGAAGAQRALRVWAWATSQRCTMAGHPTANDSVSDAAALLRWAASHCTGHGVHASAVACLAPPPPPRQRRRATPASATAGRLLG